MNRKDYDFTCDGKNYKIQTPSLDDIQASMRIYNKTFHDAITSGALLRAKLDDFIKEQNLFTLEKQIELATLQAEAQNNIKILQKGGISLSKAKQIALDIKSARKKIVGLLTIKSDLDNNTAEGQADAAKNNYLMFCSLKNEDGSRAYQDFELFLTDINSQLVGEAARWFALMNYGYAADFEKTLPENEFLIKYKFIDEKLRLINKDGQLIDETGRLIDEEGRYVNNKGEPVDFNGNRVDLDGKYSIEFQPFLDDDGKPVLLDKPKEETQDSIEKPLEVQTV